MGKSWVLGLRELGQYLLYLRVPLLLLAIAAIAFSTEQVRDVLLAMALEPEWVAFLIAALFAGLFGVLLWFSARRFSELGWMVWEIFDGLVVNVRPRIAAMPEAVVWWLPRVLGMAPPLLFAGSLAYGVGHIGVALFMVLVLVLESMALLALLYLHTRLQLRLS